MQKDSVPDTYEFASVKPSILFIVGEVLYVLVALSILIVLLWGVSENPRNWPEVTGASLVILLVLFFVVNHLCWLGFGKEHLRIHSNGVDFYNTGTTFKGHLKISWEEFEQFTLVPKPQSPHWMQWWGLGVGKIAMHYLGRKPTLGGSLSWEEVEVILAELNQIAESENTTLPLH